MLIGGLIDSHPRKYFFRKKQSNRNNNDTTTLKSLGIQCLVSIDTLYQSGKALYPFQRFFFFPFHSPSSNSARRGAVWKRRKAQGVPFFFHWRNLWQALCQVSDLLFVAKEFFGPVPALSYANIYSHPLLDSYANFVSENSRQIVSDRFQNFAIIRIPLWILSFPITLFRVSTLTRTIKLFSQL